MLHFEATAYQRRLVSNVVRRGQISNLLPPKIRGRTTVWLIQCCIKDKDQVRGNGILRRWTLSELLRMSDCTATFQGRWILHISTSGALLPSNSQDGTTLLRFDTILFYLQHSSLGFEFFISVEILMTLVIRYSVAHAVYIKSSAFIQLKSGSLINVHWTWNVRGQ